MPTSDICIRFFEFLSVASIWNRTTNVSPATNGPLTLESCTSMFFSHQSFFAAYLIDASHLCGHAFHLARFDANDIFRIKIIDRLLPFASFAKLHQSHRNIFRTHISSIVLVYFAIETASSVYSFVQILLIDDMILCRPTILLPDAAL